MWKIVQVPMLILMLKKEHLQVFIPFIKQVLIKNLLLGQQSIKNDYSKLQTFYLLMIMATDFRDSLGNLCVFQDFLFRNKNCKDYFMM